MTAQAPQTLRGLRREQVLAAARSLVSEQGIEGLTFEALERRLHFTRGVITYHFRNKDEIVEAVLAGAIDEISRASLLAADADAGREKRVLSVFEAVLKGFLEHREAVRILLSFWGRLGSDRRIREMNARLYASFRRQSRMLYPDLPARRRKAVAAVMVGLVIGLVVQEHFEPGAVDMEAALAEGGAALLAPLRGARP